MARHLWQRIHTCDHCGVTPENHERLFEVAHVTKPYEIICFSCFRTTMEYMYSDKYKEMREADIKIKNDTLCGKNSQ